MSFLRHHNQKLVIVLLLGLFSILAMYPLLKDGFPVTDDGNWLIIRFTAFFETLRSGQLPVRYIYRLNDGMGYPVSNFAYPLYLYLATPIYILGFDFVNSIKVLLIFNAFLSIVFTFLWLRERFDSLSSLVGSVALILSPYYLFDLYKRGSVGELLTFSIVPFILWQIERKNFVLISIGIALLILAHNSLAVLFLLLIISYAIIIKLDIRLLISGVFLGLGLSSFFWIPAIYDLSATVFMNTTVSNFYDYFLISKNYYLIGLSSIVIIIASLITGAFDTKLFRDKLFNFFLVLSLIIIFLNLPQSKIFWELFPFKDFIQFPFRLFSVLTVSLVYLAAFASKNLKINKLIFPAIIIVIFIIQAILFLRTVEIQKHEEGFYSTNQSTTTISDEYLNKWFIKPQLDEKIVIIAGQGKVKPVLNSPGKLAFLTDFENNGVVQINYAYFPDWKAEINDQEAAIDYMKNGLISLEIPEGKSLVNVYYEQSKIHKISNLISLISLIVLLYFIIKVLKVERTMHTLKEK